MTSSLSWYTMSRRKDVQRLAHKLMVFHCLSGWTFAFDRAKTRCGCTDYERSIISLSKYYVDDPSVSMGDVTNTILHEIAHVLAGYSAGHNAHWRAVAHSIGCDGHTYNHAWRGAPYRYRVTCICGRVCAHRHVIQDRLRRKRCMLCSTLRIVRL